MYVNVPVNVNRNDISKASRENMAHTTIKQVAEKAGVSIQTVSRVLNNRPDVSPETRLRIQSVIKDLSFQPYAIAQGLRSRRTFTLGLVASDFSDFWFSQVVTGAEIEAHAHGYFFMLGSTECDRQSEPKYLKLLSQRHVEGILFVRASSPDDLGYLSKLQHSDIPVVSTGFYFPGADFSIAEVNNVDGGIKATRYLIELGHTKIAMITGPSNWKSVNDRAQGYRQALQAGGIQVNADLIVNGENWQHKSGYLAMKELLSRKSSFTALFAHNDRMARGAISALHDAGLKVPEDISVVGYDDIPEAEFSDPPLTTVRQPMQEVGKAATNMLIQMVEDSQAVPRQILFDTELVIRSSCSQRKT